MLDLGDWDLESSRERPSADLGGAIAAVREDSHGDKLVLGRSQDPVADVVASAAGRAQRTAHVPHLQSRVRGETFHSTENFPNLNQFKPSSKDFLSASQRCEQKQAFMGAGCGPCLQQGCARLEI